ncbi:hypothetical protein RRG08_049470 [Elysia crispata]|uniref:Uncharacterized protein n=1 Tax=Elysia crispata TaxID=231223 RepID=A0AAE0ZS19_9GAST|nr:hypothetical protein RRG08_049470 [Elysia crispata]
MDRFGSFNHTEGGHLAEEVRRMERLPCSFACSRCNICCALASIGVSSSLREVRPVESLSRTRSESGGSHLVPADVRAFYSSQADEIQKDSTFITSSTAAEKKLIQRRSTLVQLLRFTSRAPQGLAPLDPLQTLSCTVAATSSANLAFWDTPQNLEHKGHIPVQGHCTV